MARTYNGSVDTIDMGWALKQGAIGGLIAGVTFAMAEMLGAYFISGNPFIMPLKMMASVPLGTPPPEIAMGTALSLGVVFHLVFSVVLGMIFAALVAKIPAQQASSTMLVVAASVYGTITWVLNFYVLAPALGRPWFTQTPPIQQFVYHTLFFGTVLGLYLASTLPRRRA